MRFAPNGCHRLLGALFCKRSVGPALYQEPFHTWREVGEQFGKSSLILIVPDRKHVRGPVFLFTDHVSCPGLSFYPDARTAEGEGGNGCRVVIRGVNKCQHIKVTQVLTIWITSFANFSSFSSSNALGAYP